MDTYIQELKNLDSQINQNSNIKKVSDDCFIFGDLNKAEKLISICIHGNETIGLPILNQLISQFTSTEVSFGLLIGNRNAINAHKRFTQKDLNRSFGINDSSTDIYEVNRAQIISKFAKNFKYILDIHQTTAACEKPFFIVRDSQEVFNFTGFFTKKFQNINIVLSSKSGLSKDGETFSEFSLKEKISFATLELGEKGIREEDTTLGTEICQYFLSHDVSSDIKELNTFQITSNIQKKNNEDQLIPGLKNLSQVEKGQLISKSDKTETHAQENSYILFPKYGEYQKQASELCQLLKPYLWSR